MLAVVEVISKKNNMNLLDQTIALFTKVRSSVIEAAAALYEVHEKGVWKEQFATWNDFLDQCAISPSSASKLMQVYRFYAIEAKVSQRKLAEVDSERLYLALKLPRGTAEERLLKASLLSRDELRQQRIYEDTGADCPHDIHICAKCHKRIP